MRWNTDRSNPLAVSDYCSFEMYHQIHRSQGTPMKLQLSIVMIALITSAVLSGCDSDSSTSAPSTTASLAVLTAGISACPTELTRARSETLLGISLPDSGHKATSNGRLCQWFSGVSWISWQWSTISLDNMVSSYEAKKVKTLGKDSGYCTRETSLGTPIDYIVSKRTVSGQTIVRIQLATNCVPDTVTMQQVWSTCRGATITTQAKRKGASVASLWIAGETVLTEACANAK
jgi:hypothetical protein